MSNNAKKKDSGLTIILGLLLKTQQPSIIPPITKYNPNGIIAPKAEVIFLRLSKNTSGPNTAYLFGKMMIGHI